MLPNNVRADLGNFREPTAVSLSNAGSSIIMWNKRTSSIGPRLLRRWLWLLGSLALLVVMACGGAASATNPATTSAGSGETPTSTPGPAVQSESGTLAESDTGAKFPQTPDSPSGGDETPANQPAPSPLEVPAVDRSIHSVPLEDIVFDTFGGSPRFLPLDQASDERILRLRDLIKPISEPAYGLLETCRG